MTAANAHPLTPEQVAMLPRGVPTAILPCPACFANPGEPCTTPTDTGRRAVKSLHWDRVPRASFPSRFGIGVPDEGEGYGAAL